MLASPPGNVFPALVVVGHIVTLIVAWQWRVRKKQGKEKKTPLRLVSARLCFRRGDGAAFQRKLDQSLVCADSFSASVLVRRVCSLCVFVCAHFSSRPHSPLGFFFFFSLTRLGFLWYGDVAVNPVSAGCDVMTSDMEYSARLRGGGAFLPRQSFVSSAPLTGFFLEWRFSIIFSSWLCLCRDLT